MSPHSLSAVDTSEAGIFALVVAFDTQQLPKTQWTHETHLLVALYFVYHDPAPLERMRAGIQRLNAAHSVATTPTGGYHETLTRFYLWALQQYVTEGRQRLGQGVTLTELAAGVLHRVTRELPLLYYSMDRLHSPEARCSWVEPDLRPL
jgi:hypothetical protein